MYAGSAPDSFNNLVTSLEPMSHAHPAAELSSIQQNHAAYSRSEHGKILIPLLKGV